MATLSRELRNALESAVLAARRQAEAGARKALEQLAVAHHEPWATMTTVQQSLRRRLRARGRQLGDRLEDRGKQAIEHLVAECAYEHWHRMLFARFLAECGLLIEPASGVPVSVEECKELARERRLDWISLASTFAQEMLPQIFRSDDAVLEIALPPEHRQPLEQILSSLPSEVFLADDSLGWVYQFWQSDEKDRVNESEGKIGADQLPAVTQLFTEDYMVEFLLHNTLGAWWAGRRFPNGVTAASEEEARSVLALPSVEWKYLRFVEEGAARWIPASGIFAGWPQTARELRLLDPSMGSGHFLVSALPILVAMRRLEEGTPLAGACAAVVKENIFGLEIDARCTQIGAFNLALSSWKLAGWQSLPPLNIACSGLAPNARREDWVRLAGDDEKARLGMGQLYDLFAQGPLLGSLIDPRQLGADLLAKGFHELQPLVEKALAKEPDDEKARELAVTAQGITRAAEILAGRFNLVVTNVPYLGRGRQHEALQDYCELHHGNAKADLATCFAERCLGFCESGGSVALVTPQNWLFLKTYTAFRKQTLRQCQWNLVFKLGPRAFETISGEVVNVILIAVTKSATSEIHKCCGLEASERRTPSDKALAIRHDPLSYVLQASLTQNPNAAWSFEAIDSSRLLGRYAECFQGISTGDAARLALFFWEVPLPSNKWRWFQSPPAGTGDYRGREYVVDWMTLEAGVEGSAIRGREAWGKPGVAIGQMSGLPATIYDGELFSNSTPVIIPKRPEYLPAIWEFCRSPQFNEALRKLNPKMSVDNGYVSKVPFDFDLWQHVAGENSPAGIPRPESANPTQWLFAGHPLASEQPLQVAVARLLGYRWPRQTGSDFLDCSAIGPDALDGLQAQDGIVCISASKGEESGVSRLGSLMAVAYGGDWNATLLDELLARVGFAGATLEEWLRDGCFAQHCELFQQCPFIWHIWDGRRDGFSALVNYHTLNRANFEKLTYAHLGDWITRQQASVAAGEAGSDARLVAATQLQEQLKKILEGEPPYDIFVRWKSLAQQPIGWEPDLNDGVRVNIRPLMMAADLGKKGAGVLRVKPNVKWDKDRGTETSRPKDECPWFWGWDGKARDFAGGVGFDGRRWNDLHYTRGYKMAARRQKGIA